MTTTNTNGTARARLAKKLQPIYEALGNVLSTSAGKTLAALAYDAGRCYESSSASARQSARKYPTRQHEHDTNSANHWLGKRLAYVDALSMMVSEATGFTACAHNCRMVINGELAALEDMSDSERSAVNISRLLACHF